MGWANTDKATRNAYDRAYRAKRRARGMCQWCAEPVQVTLLCRTCARKRAERRNALRAAKRLAQQAAA